MGEKKFPRHLRRRPSYEERAFRRFDADELPILVLGTMLRPPENENISRATRADWEAQNHVIGAARPKRQRDWALITHQTAGHACHQKYIFGTILRMRPSIVDAVKLIATEWLSSDAGMFGISLDKILRYRRMILRLGVDCPYSYPDFEEGFYPIDYSPAAVRRLALDRIPKDPDDLFVWKSKHARFIGLVGRWDIYILGENCD